MTRITLQRASRHRSGSPATGLAPYRRGHIDFENLAMARRRSDADSRQPASLENQRSSHRRNRGSSRHCGFLSAAGTSACRPGKSSFPCRRERPSSLLRAEFQSRVETRRFNERASSPSARTGNVPFPLCPGRQSHRCRARSSRPFRHCRRLSSTGRRTIETLLEIPRRVARGYCDALGCR